MFKEILKIIPRLESKDLNDMERTLNSRFGRVAKKFGSGFASILKGGAVLGAATFLIDKLMNPLKEVEDSIGRALNRGDDLVTYAKQFNTTEGNLARLQAFGEASGLEPEALRLLLGKFQSAVADAAKDPTKTTAVSAYIGEKDTAVAFFEFIQAMQKLPTDIEKNLVQQEVFGEKQILKASEFLNQNFKDLAMQLKGPGTETVTAAAKFLGSESDRRDLNRAGRNYNDLVSKAGILGTKQGQGTLDLIDYREKMALNQENIRLQDGANIAKIAVASDKLANLIENAYLKLAPVIANGLPELINLLSTTAKTVEKSRAIRGMLPGKED